MKSDYIRYSIIAAAIVVVLWGLSWFLINTYVSNNDRGTFGDMFGAVNALFSGLAFAGIIITILLQHQELKETRDEFIEQNKTLRMQRFENTFFNLMSLHNDIQANLIVYMNTKNRVKGNGFFDGYIIASGLNKIDPASTNSLQIMIGAFNKAGILGDCTGYLLSLKSIFNLIRFSDQLKSDSERNIYFEILNNKLSKKERSFLLYYMALAAPDDLKNTILEMERELNFIRTIGILDLAHVDQLDFLVSHINRKLNRNW